MRDRALVVFRRLFEAEASAHGMAPEAVHLHEAGAYDAIADIVGCAAALDALAPDRIVVSPVTTGSGVVACAHGILPVPGPATAALLAGVPLSGIEAQGERLTPTGAAMLTSIAQDLAGGLPAMTLRSIGLGAGSRDDPERPNIVRALLGEREAPVAVHTAGSDGDVLVVEFTVDDATPQLLAYAAERLREAGAKDLHIVSALMKKGRPGHLVTVLAHPDAFGAITRTALVETTTWACVPARGARRARPRARARGDRVRAGAREDRTPRAASSCRAARVRRLRRGRAPPRSPPPGRSARRLFPGRAKSSRTKRKVVPR